MLERVNVEKRREMKREKRKYRREKMVMLFTFWKRH